MVSVMRVAILTREYPPDVYGGAGVHVEFLVRELRSLIDVDVHCFGARRDEPGVRAYATPAGLAGANPALQTLGVDLEMAAAVADADVVHSHTWYANVAGVLGAQLHGRPHVLSAHSLEPARPWKAEQLGGGYRISSWAEREGYASADAIIAVSSGMRDDILAVYPFVDPRRVHVIYNGIDTGMYSPGTSTDALERFGVDPERPSANFVGRITPQKGLIHLLHAAASFDPEVQLVLCAGAPDTPEIAAETAATVEALRAERSGVVWIREMLPRPDVIQLLSHATVFVCPSVYEPLGIVNLEAMACRTAVVASDVGGIPEVVEHGVTGTLVHYDASAPEEFEAGVGAAVNALARDPAGTAALAAAGRERAVAQFGWPAIAQRTVELYRSLL
jgi:starch synthase